MYIAKIQLGRRDLDRAKIWGRIRARIRVCAWSAIEFKKSKHAPQECLGFESGKAALRGEIIDLGKTRAGISEEERMWI